MVTYAQAWVFFSSYFSKEKIQQRLSKIENLTRPTFWSFNYLQTSLDSVGDDCQITAEMVEF